MAKVEGAKRAHRATYSTDKKKGGYIIRIEGPNAASFVGRAVPVTTKGGDEHEETLVRLIWSGADQESGKPVALYAFESKPKSKADEVSF